MVIRMQKECVEISGEDSVAGGGCCRSRQFLPVSACGVALGEEARLVWELFVNKVKSYERQATDSNIELLHGVFICGC